MAPFVKDIVMGDLCAFTAGYFVFLAETVATVNSVLHFMPGMRTVVSTDPTYFSVFNRCVTRQLIFFVSSCRCLEPAYDYDSVRTDYCCYLRIIRGGRSITDVSI